MKKLPIIGMFFFLFMIPATLVAITIGGSAEFIDLPPRTWERALANFDNRWHEYQESPPVPQAVLIGPSYGAIGYVKGVRNLSVGGMRPAELDKLLNQLRPQDTIFFAMTIIDSAAVHAKPRRDLHNPLLRRLSIFRVMLAPGAATPRQWIGRPITDDDMADLREMYPPSMRLNIIGDQLIWFSSDDRSPVDMTRYEKIHRRYPNVVFLLFPTYPTAPEIEDCDMAARAQFFCDATADFHSLWHDIPYIDFSDTLSQEHFMDLFHYTPEGKSLIRARLREIVTRPPLSASSPI